VLLEVDRQIEEGEGILATGVYRVELVSGP
jgi:hypothetical protein